MSLRLTSICLYICGVLLSEFYLRGGRKPGYASPPDGKSSPPPPPGAMFPPINPQINNVISAEVVNEMQCVCANTSAQLAMLCCSICSKYLPNHHY